MINIESTESACPDLNRYEKIARVLTQELQGLSLGSEPLDVTESLENLSDEMARMPEVIYDCRLATEVFDELNQAIEPMYALADRAVELPENSHNERRALDDEFKSYAHIVARLGGADNYDGPSLSLANRPEALAARTILGYLNNARNSFTKKLADQRRHINMAMNEALALLAQIVYDTDGLSHSNRGRLKNILDRLGPFTGEAEPAEMKPRAGGSFH